MAELDASAGAHKKAPGVRKGKKLSTRVDLTPMVDLGFLLITFFIFTTEMSKPHALKLIMPKDVPDDQRMLAKVSDVITLIPAGNDLVYYYEGDDPTKMKFAGFKDLRNVILDKKWRTDTAWFQVILKPARDATYKNTIDILDEMTIDAVPHFALVDITPAEYALIRTSEQAIGIR
jgi:biopolymer transport protein ExbD